MTTLAVTYHDPDGRLHEQSQRHLPWLADHFQRIVMQATTQSRSRILDLWRAADAEIEQHDVVDYALKIGRVRRQVVAQALKAGPGPILYCDADRVLHWAAHYPEELAHVAVQIGASDFTVLGRTERAFAGHPRIQRDTERITNYVFRRVSGWSWDITAAARGLSQRAARAIVADCPEDTVGAEAVWPLFLRERGGFTFAYMATEGLEFETAARHQSEVEAAGGYAQWLSNLSSDPRRWQERLRLVQVVIDAMTPYGAPYAEEEAEEED